MGRCREVWGDVGRYGEKVREVGSAWVGVGVGVGVGVKLHVLAQRLRVPSVDERQPEDGALPLEA